MSKAGTFMEQLNSVDFSTLLAETVKNSQNYKSPQTFCFTQQETQKSVYVSFFSAERLGVYAITRMDGVTSNLYRVRLANNRVRYDLLSNYNKGAMHPKIDALISEANEFKMQRDFLWVSSNELEAVLGNLNREAESIILDYIKYLFTEEDTTVESTRRKLEANLGDFYSEVSRVSEKEVEQAVFSFLGKNGFINDGRLTTFVSDYGKKTTKVIDCLSIDGERAIFLVSYTNDAARDCLVNFVVNTVGDGMKIDGHKFYVEKLHETHYKSLKTLVD